jgi:hypothetical protein
MTTWSETMEAPADMRVFGRHTAERTSTSTHATQWLIHGGWTTCWRLQEMDAEGIAAEGIFWGHPLRVRGPTP